MTLGTRNTVRPSRPSFSLTLAMSHVQQNWTSQSFDEAYVEHSKGAGRGRVQKSASVFS